MGERILKMSDCIRGQGPWINRKHCVEFIVPKVDEHYRMTWANLMRLPCHSQLYHLFRNLNSPWLWKACLKLIALSQKMRFGCRLRRLVGRFADTPGVKYMFLATIQSGRIQDNVAESKILFVESRKWRSRCYEQQFGGNWARMMIF